MGIETAILGVIVLASTAISYVGMQKAKKLSRQDVEKARGINAQVRATAQPRRFVIGTARVGGLDAYFNVSGSQNEYLHFVCIWCDGPIKAVKNLLLDGKIVPMVKFAEDQNVYVPEPGNKYEGLIRWESERGFDNQGAIGIGIIPGWTVTDELKGCAYSWIELKYDPDVFESGQPDLSAIIDGQENIFDPRDSTYKFSTNVALAWAWYMTLQKKGPGINYATKIGEPELIAAANDCDDLIPLSVNVGGTTTDAGLSENTYGGLEVTGEEPRYSINHLFTLSQSPEEIIEIFRTAMAGQIVNINGRWKPYAGVWVAPTFIIREDMLVGVVKKKEKVSRRDRFNTVTGIYVSAATEWEPTGFPIYAPQIYIDKDKGESLPTDIDLSPVASVSQCRRIAKITLLRSRFERSVQLSLNFRAYRAQSAKTVYVHLPNHGFNMMPADVLGVDLIVADNKLRIDLDLKQTDPSIYDWDVAGTGPGFDSDFAGQTDKTEIEQPNPPDVGYGPEYYPNRIELLQKTPATTLVYCKARGGNVTLAGEPEFTTPSTPPRYYKEIKQSGSQVLCNYESPGGFGCAEDSCPDPTGKHFWLQGRWACWDGDSYQITSVRADFHIDAMYDAGGGNVSIDWRCIVSSDGDGGGAGYNVEVYFGSGVSPIIFSGAETTHTGTATYPNNHASAILIQISTNSSVCGGVATNPVAGTGEVAGFPAKTGNPVINTSQNVTWCVVASNSVRKLAKGSAIFDPSISNTVPATDNRELETIVQANGCTPPMSGGTDVSTDDPFRGLDSMVTAVVVARTTKTQASTFFCDGDRRITSSTTKVELLDEDTEEEAIERMLADQPTYGELEWGDALLTPPAGPLYTEDGCPSEWSGRGYGAYTGRSLTYLAKRMKIAVTGMNANSQYKIRAFFDGRYLPDNTVHPQAKVITLESFTADAFGGGEFEFDLPIQEYWRYWLKEIRYYTLPQS